MNILLFGPNGQVGFELTRSLSSLGNIILCPRSVVDLDHNLSHLDSFIERTAPDIIVNAAGYTQVDLAENNENLSQCINTDAPLIMAEAAKKIGAYLIHYSTDYVFDGKKSSAYVETDPVNPINIYGKTKAQGEEAIRSTDCKHIILRTSWIYSTRGKNFLNTMLNLARTQTQMNIVDDQIGAPTSAEMIADITALILYRIQTDPTVLTSPGNTFHLTASGSTSWHGFAQYIIETALKKGAALKTKPGDVLKISTQQYPTPAKRPLNSRLNTESLCKHFGFVLPEWQVHVYRILSELESTGAL